MKNFSALIILFSVGAASAGVPEAVLKAAEKLKTTHIRVVTTEVQNTLGYPCLPEGTSYNLDLQIKRADYDAAKNVMNYTWESAKVVNVSPTGSMMEVCTE